MSIGQTQPQFLYGLKHFFSLSLLGNILASQGLCKNVLSRMREWLGLDPWNGEKLVQNFELTCSSSHFI